MGQFKAVTVALSTRGASRHLPVKVHEQKWRHSDVA